MVIANCCFSVALVPFSSPFSAKCPMSRKIYATCDGNQDDCPKGWLRLSVLVAVWTLSSLMQFSEEWETFSTELAVVFGSDIKWILNTNGPES